MRLELAARARHAVVPDYLEIITVAQKTYCRSTRYSTKKSTPFFNVSLEPTTSLFLMFARSICARSGTASSWGARITMPLRAKIQTPAFAGKAPVS